MCASQLGLWVLVTVLASPCGLFAQQPTSRVIHVNPGEAVDLNKLLQNPSSGPASAPVAVPTSMPAAHETYMHGDYAAATEGYANLAKQESLQTLASVGLAETLNAQGKYAEAAAALDKAKTGGSKNLRWHLAYADSLQARGEYAEALEHAAKATELDPMSAPAIFVRGQLLETLGRKAEAVKVYALMQAIVSGEAFRSDPEALTAIGKIMDRYSVLTGRRASDQATNILQTYLQGAQQVDKTYWPANLAAGNFLCSKYKFDDGAAEYKLALKKNPHCAEAFVGLASIALQGWRFEQAMALADSALAINPNSTDALYVKASCLMGWRKYDQVGPALEKILAINPNHLEALSLYAAFYVRLGQDDKAKPYMDRVHKVNPTCARLPETIADWLCAARQFPQAETLYKQAMKLAPEAADPIAGLGLLYLQTGDEDKAVDVLQKANRIDDFRVDVVNYLQLLSQISRFRVKETPHFIVKVDPADAILLDPVADFMEATHKELSARYGFTPSTKTLIEIFPTHPQFSVRITGKGWIGTIGAATGRVIALVAPNSERSPFGTFDWGTVLRHEYTHTITLEGTHFRIPHWFTEACAVFEQPDRMNFEAMAQLVAATRTGKLFSVKELDWGFIRPQKAADRGLAYAQAEWIMEYIIAKHKFETILKMLKAFDAGRAQAQVFAEVLHTTEPQFDKDFAAWASEQIHLWGYDNHPVLPAPEAQKIAASQPANIEAQCNLADSLQWVGQAVSAAQAARKALAQDPKNIRANELLSVAQASAGQWDDALKAAKALDALAADNRVAATVLAHYYVNKQQFTLAIPALERMKVLAPRDPYSYTELADLYTQSGRVEKALPDLLEMNRRSITDARWARQIADIYRAMNQYDEALKYYESICRINPYEVSAYQAIAAIYRRAGRFDKAVAAMRNVLMLEPKDDEAWAGLAAMQFQLARQTHDAQVLGECIESCNKSLELDSESPAKEILAAAQTLRNELPAATTASAPASEPAAAP